MADSQKNLDFLKPRLLREVWRHSFVGGMPEAVASYRKTGKMVDAFAVHAELGRSFRDDFAKYTPRVNPLAIVQRPDRAGQDPLDPPRAAMRDSRRRFHRSSSRERVDDVSIYSPAAAG